MESLRVRGEANNDPFPEGTHFEDYEWGVAVPAVETGTLNRTAALLMQAGFNARLAAIKAVHDTGAEFRTSVDLAQWLQSDAIRARATDPEWPTAASHDVWLAFIGSCTPADRTEWKTWTYTAQAVWDAGQVVPAANSAIRLVQTADQSQTLILRRISPN